MLPEISPITVGAKIAVNVAVCPEASVSGSSGPWTLNPLPARVVCVIVKFPVPEFVTLRLFLLLEPMATFPKARFEGVIALLTGDTHPGTLRVKDKITKNRIALQGSWPV